MGIIYRDAYYTTEYGSTAGVGNGLAKQDGHGRHYLDIPDQFIWISK